MAWVTMLAADAGPAPECVVKDGGTPDCGVLTVDGGVPLPAKLKLPPPPPQILQEAKQLEALILDARKGAKKLKE